MSFIIIKDLFFFVVLYKEIIMDISTPRFPKGQRPSPGTLGNYTYSTGLFIIAIILAIVGLILASILWADTFSHNATICNNCPGIVDIIETDNSSLSPIINQTLKLNGVCGIETFINLLDNITITNNRDLSPYVVGQDTCSEYSTPQAAYTQAILDGKGGDSGPPAIIIIKPGVYSFGSTQFQILQTGITFFGLPGQQVYFSSTSTTGGIYINTLPTTLTSVIFQGISFGNIGDSTNGFLLNVSSGNTIIQSCYTMNSNFRIYVGTEDTTTLGLYDSFFNTIPPNDFITTVAPDVFLTLQNVYINDLLGTIGGNIFNLSPGFNKLTILSSNIIFQFYEGVILGPVTAVSYTSGNLIFSRFITVNGLFSNFPNYFCLQNGLIIYDIGDSVFYLQGSFIIQNLPSTQTDLISIKLIDTEIQTDNSTILYDPAVTTIATVLIQTFHCYFKNVFVNYTIVIPSGTLPDALDIEMLNTIITNLAPPGGVYMIGPGATIGTIVLANTVAVNQATTASGMTVINLVNL